MSTICRNCGNTVPDNQAFCNYCGTPLQQSQQTMWQPPAQQPVQQPVQSYNNNGNNYYQPPRVEAPPTSQGSNTNTLLMVLVGVLAAMVVGLGVWWATSSRSSNTGSTSQVTTSTTTTTSNDALTELMQVVSQRDLTATEVASLDKDQRRLLRNYIFARHGYIFKDTQLQNYFNQFDWYHGQHTSADLVSKYFNDVEKANVDRLVDTSSSSGPLSSGYYSFVGHCNLREYPTSDSYIVGTAENNYSCYVSGEHEGSWYWVTVTQTGVSGWTHRQNIRK